MIDQLLSIDLIRETILHYVIHFRMAKAHERPLAAVYTCFRWERLTCHEIFGPPKCTDPPGPNISKYLDPLWNIWTVCVAPVVHVWLIVKRMEGQGLFVLGMILYSPGSRRYGRVLQLWGVVSCTKLFSPTQAALNYTASLWFCNKCNNKKIKTLKM